MFDRAFVINLPFKYDRLMKFQNSYPSCLPPCEVWPAVHGDSVRHPDWWHSGSGAWGCYRSHMQVLEYCYQQKEKIGSYIVFEDDAIFRPDFEERYAEFMGSLPNDWEQIYLGGQLLHEDQFPPQKINHHVFFPKNVNRTHCFAVHRRGYERLYKHLNALPFASQDHIDHHLGRLHDTGNLRLYVPPRWLVGQDGGLSNISGNNNSATFWADPENLATNHRIADATRAIPTVFLEAKLEVALELERRGWHRGHWQDEQRLDRGVCNAIAGTNMNADLQNWEKCVLPEAVREGKTCACLFHPALTWDQVQGVGFSKITRIVANDVADAERQLMAIDAPSRASKKQQRNLIYFIWPKLGNGEWEWNVEELLKRIDQFDGSRSIAVATGDGAAQLVDVQRAFDGVRIDNWLEFPNDPNLGEVVAFSSLLKTIQREAGYTFYAHAKGVSYDNHETHEWTEMLYEICLDDPEYVEESLKQFPVTGPFTVIGEWKAGNAHSWFYSGAFYWFRNADLKQKPNWMDVDPAHRWQAELYLGNHFAIEEAGVLFGQNAGHLYEANELDRMRAWMEQWRNQSRPRSPADYPSVSIIIPTLGRPLLKRMLESLLPQLSERDEIIVVADGEDALIRVKALCDGLPVTISEASNSLSVYGNHQRNHGITMANGDLLWFCDDDDTVPVDALNTIKSVMKANRLHPTMFRQNHLGHIIWGKEEIVDGQVSSTQLIVPNDGKLLPFPVPTTPDRGSDFRWITEINKTRPILWDQSVIYICEQSREGRFE